MTPAVRLADGRHIVVRELSPRDGAALVAALETAPAEHLRRRYLGCPPPASFLIKQLDAADGVHHAYIGAFASDGTLVGSAQFDRSDNQPTAEIAVQVAADWQQDGIGTALLQQLADVARDRGVTRFSATYFADNQPLRRLLSDLGYPVVASCAEGEGHAVLELCAPDLGPRDPGGNRSDSCAEA